MNILCEKSNIQNYTKCFFLWVVSKAELGACRQGQILGRTILIGAINQLTF